MLCLRVLDLPIDPILERKTKVLVELRSYKVLEEEKRENDIFTLVEDREGRKILVWTTSIMDIGIKHVNQMAKYMKEKGVENGIIVGNKYTQSAKTQAKKENIELIPQDFPSFNIFKHYLVPKHEILSPEEKQALLEKYHIEPYKLPRIKASDPAIRLIGAKPGDIVKIVRRSPTAGESVYYRYVVEG